MEDKIDYDLRDRVFCQNNTGVEDFLFKWSVYTINDITYDPKKGTLAEVIDNKGNRHYFKSYRFKKNISGIIHW